MMEQNKEQLEKLLQFIDQLGQNPDNAWFVDRLKEKYVTAVKRNHTIDINDMLMENDVNRLKVRISNIEKYLGLDFDTDTANSIIDYSGINDMNVRNQLESDNREMLRYRHGTRSHKVDFYEFCKYAHFQAEMLLNFVYEPIAPYTISDCKEHIKYFFPTAMISDKTSSPSDITYFAKMLAFTEEFFHVDGVSSKGYPNKSKIFWTLKRIEDTRNITNHRGKDDILTDNFKDWLYKTPFDEVIDALKLLAEQVQSIDQTKFLTVSQKWLNATISNILPSATFVKTDNGESIQFPENLLKVIGGKKKGDVIQIKVDPSGSIIDIK